MFHSLNKERRGDCSLGESEQIDENVLSKGNISAIGRIGARLAGNRPDISRSHHLNSCLAEPPNRATRIKSIWAAMLPPARNTNFEHSEPSGWTAPERNRRPIYLNRLKAI